MKKLLLSLLFAGVLAGGAFAQVSFSGSVYAGVRLHIPYDGDESITTNHRDYDDPEFNLTATVMRENYGARLVTRTRMLDGEADFAVRGAYGWVNFAGPFGDDSLRLTVGQISSPAWVTRLHSSLVEQYFDNVRGFRVEYDTPVQGLSVGAAFRAEGQDAEGFGRQMIFGANFFHPMFNAVFAYDLSSDVRTLFGLNFTGIPDLTAGLQLLAMNLATWDEPLNFGTLDLHQIVGYRVARPLFVYLLLGQSFDGNPDNDYVGMSFTPGVEYRVTQNLTASFSLTLESPDRFTTTNLTLNPLLEYTLTGPAMLYVEYELRLDNMDRASHTFGFGVTIRAF